MSRLEFRLTVRNVHGQAVLFIWRKAEREVSTDPSRARLAQSGRAQSWSEAARSRSPPGRGDVDVGERSPEERRSPGRSRFRALVSDEPDRCDYPDAALVWPTSTRRKRRSPQTGELTGRTLLAGNVQQPGISRQSGNTEQQRRLCVVGIEGRPTPPTRGSRSNPHSAFTSDPLRRPVSGLPVIGLIAVGRQDRANPAGSAPLPTRPNSLPACYSEQTTSDSNRAGNHELLADTSLRPRRTTPTDMRGGPTHGKAIVARCRWHVRTANRSRLHRRPGDAPRRTDKSTRRRLTQAKSARRTAKVLTDSREVRARYPGKCPTQHIMCAVHSGLLPSSSALSP